MQKKEGYFQNRFRICSDLTEYSELFRFGAQIERQERTARLIIPGEMNIMDLQKALNS